MNSRFTSQLVLMLLLLFSTACAPAAATPDQNMVATLAALQITQTAIAAGPTATEVPSATPPPQFGSISGDLSFPSEGTPALRVIAFDLSIGQTYAVETAPNQASYRIEDLPAGQYHLVAYTLDATLSGGYTHAVRCGLSANCTDHSLVEITVEPGQEVTGINPSDWYAPPGSFPIDPLAPAPVFGTISGSLSFPSEAIPSLRVVAFNSDTGQYYYVETNQNQTTYTITGLPAGVYHVIAYVEGGATGGGYSQAVPCGLSVNCSDHSLIDVTVTPGQDTPGVDPKDWYAPPGTFPPDPVAPPVLSGSISGSLSFPSEGIPPLRVVAFNIGTGEYYFVTTVQNQGTYIIENLTAGVYHVVAYVLDGSYAGGYSQAVPCGLSVNCADHSLIDVTVNPDQETTNINPADWYAPPGSFPPAP
ncbi:MAG: carboxypeptidase-like regulatory domain-containing protein [Chloroflexota bacterium]